MQKIILELTERPLRILERFMGTDVSYLARGGFWLSLGSIAGSIIAFMLSLAYARYLPEEVYGEYRYIFSLLSIAGVFALPGIGLATTRAVARGFAGTFRTGLRLSFLSSFAISIFSAAIGIFFFYQGKNSLAFSFFAVAFFVPFVEGLGNWKAYLDGRKEFQKKTIFNTIAHIFYGLCMLVGVTSIQLWELSPTASVFALSVAYLCGHALPNTLFSLRMLREVSKTAPQEKGSLRYGVTLSLIGIPATVAAYIDGIILYYFLGPAALAVYSFAIAPAEQVKSLLANIATVSFPKLSQQMADQQNIQELKKSLLWKTLKASSFTAIGTLLYIALSPFLFQLFFPRYLESVPFSQIFILPLIFFPLSIFSTAIITEGNMKKVYAYKFGVPIIQIILLLALIPFFGIWGAILGRVIGRLVSIFLPFVLFIAL